MGLGREIAPCKYISCRNKLKKMRAKSLFEDCIEYICPQVNWNLKKRGQLRSNNVASPL
jgi:hypothetical protein